MCVNGQDDRMRKLLDSLRTGNSGTPLPPTLFRTEQDDDDMGFGLCRPVNLVTKWKVDSEGSGLIILIGLFSETPYSTGITVLQKYLRAFQEFIYII